MLCFFTFFPMAIISCVHNRRSFSTIPPSSSPPSSDGVLLIVRSTYQILERMKYHHRDGRVLVSPYACRRPPTESNPFNPFCPSCSGDFLRRLVKLVGFTRSEATLVLQCLRERVFHELLNLNHDSQVIELVYDIVREADLHTWYPRAYLAWLKYIGMLQLAYNKPRGSQSLTLQAMDLDKMLTEGSRWNTEKCTICLEGLVAIAQKELMPPAAIVLKLPCEHAFHGSCIQEWLNETRSCPLCRFKLPC